jgi:hypothetical protein
MGWLCGVVCLEPVVCCCCVWQRCSRAVHRDTVGRGAQLDWWLAPPVLRSLPPEVQAWTGEGVVVWAQECGRLPPVEASRLSVIQGPMLTWVSEEHLRRLGLSAIAASKLLMVMQEGLWSPRKPVRTVPPAVRSWSAEVVFQWATTVVKVRLRLVEPTRTRYSVP